MVEHFATFSNKICCELVVNHFTDGEFIVNRMKRTVVEQKMLVWM